MFTEDLCCLPNIHRILIYSGISNNSLISEMSHGWFRLGMVVLVSLVRDWFKEDMWPNSG